MSEFKGDLDILEAEVEKKIREAGYVYPTPAFISAISEDMKQFDTEVSEMQNDELINKQAVFTSLFASASVDEAKYSARVAAIERQLVVAKANAFNASTGDKVRERERQRDSNDKVVTLQEKLTVADHILKLYTALRISYEAYWKLYSRAIAVRIEEKKM
jgi:hypothetical protein